MAGSRGGGAGGAAGGGHGGSDGVAGGVSGTAGAAGGTSTGGVAGTGGTAGSAGAGGQEASGGSGGSTSAQDGGSDAACQSAASKLVAQTPTVYVLVDRSASMFHCLSGNTGDAVCADPTNTAWYTFKMAIESLLIQVDSRVRFGFATVYGTNPSGGGMCPSLQGVLTNNVAPTLNNATTIAGLYDGLSLPPNSTQVGTKFEGPSSESIGVVTQALLADTDPGSKYLLFVTDAAPDYCDDSNSLCAPDSVIWKLQAAFTAGIRTIVFGVQTSLFDVAPGVLQGFANAGAGEPTLAPVKTGGSIFDFYDQCDGIAGWAADLTASGQTAARGVTLGTYSTTMGPTMPYTPSASSVAQLVSQLGSATCNYPVPTAIQGSVDFGKVNVQLTSGAGTVTTIGYRTSKDQCSNGGWYYDVPPSAGTPTQIVICPSTCSNFPADAQILLGCATIQ